MKIILKPGRYHYSDLTEEQLTWIRNDGFNMYVNDILEITSGMLVKFEDGTYKKFSNNLSYLEYLHDKKQA